MYAKLINFRLGKNYHLSISLSSRQWNNQIKSYRNSVGRSFAKNLWFWVKGARKITHQPCSRDIKKSFRLGIVLLNWYKMTTLLRNFLDLRYLGSFGMWECLEDTKYCNLWPKIAKRAQKITHRPCSRDIKKSFQLGIVWPLATTWQLGLDLRYCGRED